MTQATYQRVYTPLAIDEAISLVTNRISGVHQACADVPRIGARDFDQLVESIEANGLLRPIEVNNQNLLIDGRSRIQAYAVLGLELRENDIVVTDADPFAIARSNNARRHLTDGQKTMEAARLLEDEQKRAAERRKQGAAKGRMSKQNSLGTKSVPSEKALQKRAPRAIDRVAAASGVSRDNLTKAKRLREVSPELAAKVETGELPLAAAAEQAGVSVKTKSMPKQSSPGARLQSAEASHEPASERRSLVWKDNATQITDFPSGIRVHRCPNATFFAHKNERLTGVVLPARNEWWWLVSPGTDDEQGTHVDRKDAEAAVRKHLAKRLRERQPKQALTAFKPKTPFNPFKQKTAAEPNKPR